LRESASNTIKISSGGVEDAFTGEGPAVLDSHGTLGGFDQGLAIGQQFDRTKFRFHCASRSGNLRSSPSTGLIPDNQAQTYVELLDQVGISRMAVLGVFGRAPSALRFVQDYPERCWASVLISPIYRTHQLPTAFQLMVRAQEFMMEFDSLWVRVYEYGLGILLRANGLSASQVEQVITDPPT
jgi:2-hydroxy-6-oxonona-2,4-dienedioate hydrolase